jgi:hypothetical protein
VHSLKSTRALEWPLCKQETRATLCMCIQRTMAVNRNKGCNVCPYGTATHKSADRDKHWDALSVSEEPFGFEYT